MQCCHHHVDFVLLIVPSHCSIQRGHTLTPVTRRNGKHGHDDNNGPSMSDILLMISNQQMQEMRQHVEDCKDKMEERRLRMEEQWEDQRLQMQMQQQLMLSMMMVGGQGPPLIPPMGLKEGDGDESKQNKGEGKSEE